MGRDILHWQRQSLYLNPIQDASLTEDKTEGRKTHKQAPAEGSCSKRLAKHLAREEPKHLVIFHGFQLSGRGFSLKY